MGDADLEMATYALAAAVFHLEGYLAREAQLGSYRKAPHPELRAELSRTKEVLLSVRKLGGFS